jgi:hypothetical protein
MSKEVPLCCYIYYSNRTELEPPKRRMPQHADSPEYEQPTSRYHGDTEFTVSKKVLHTWGLLRTFFPWLLLSLFTRVYNSTRLDSFVISRQIERKSKLHMLRLRDR